MSVAFHDPVVEKAFRIASKVVEKELNLPAGFLKRLVELEDDWSFVIKTHALIEATVTSLLAESVDPKLRETFKHLALSDAQTGKLAFAQALELVDGGGRRFVQKLSELRNGLVHDASRVSFTFEEHLGTLDTNQRRAFADMVIAMVPDVTRVRVLERPKVYVWFAMLKFVSKSMETVLKAKWTRDDEKESMKTGREMSEPKQERLASRKRKSKSSSTP